MPVLIAGGCGFIGSHLARKLVEKGEHVIIFYHSPNTEPIKDIVDRVTPVSYTHLTLPTTERV